MTSIAHRGMAGLIVGILLWLPCMSLARERSSLVFLGLQGLGIDAQGARSLQTAIEEKIGRNRWFQIVTRTDPHLTERCKADAKCYCAELAGRQASHAFYANAGHIPPLYTFELVLIDLQSCSVVNTLFLSEMHDGASARIRIGEMTDRLLKPPETLSETVAKARRDVDKVPAVVTVISDEQIQNLGITRLQEALRLVPGFEIVDTNWGDLVLHHGLTSTLLYMVDGVPMSNPMFNFAIIDRDFRLAINHVERIELVRGPGSVLWGQNAFLGIVNLITRTPAGKGERLRAHLRFGTLDTQEIFASAEGNRRWFAYYLSTTWMRSEGPQTRVDNSLWATDLGAGIDQPIWGNAGTTDNKADSYYDVTAKVRIAAKLELKLQYFSNLTNFEISPFGALLSADDHGFWDTTHLLYAASWEDALPRGFRYRLSASRYEHRAWENFVVYPKNPDVLPFGFASLQGNELQPELNHLVEGRVYHAFGWGSLSNSSLLGLSYLHQFMPVQYATLTTGQEEGTEELDIESHIIHTLSIFAQDDLSLLDDRLWLSAGLRYDHHDPFQSALSAQGAVIGGTEWLHAKLSYNEGFRPPSMNNLYSTKGVKGNPGLRPERSRALSLELASRPLGPFTLRLGATIAWLNDLIKMVEASAELKSQGFANTPKNLDWIRIYATHAEVLLSLYRLDAFVNYAYKHLEEGDPIGKGIPLANHTASGGASLRVFYDLYAFATATLVGPRTIDVGLSGFSPLRQNIRAFVLVDVGLSIRNVLDMFDLTVKARNPARYLTWSPYLFDGRPTPILERRRVSEVLFTLGWSGRPPWSNEEAATGK